MQQVVDTMLIPPTAELGLTILDRIQRTPWLKVYEEIVLILGLQGGVVQVEPGLFNALDFSA